VSLAIVRRREGKSEKAKARRARMDKQIVRTRPLSREIRKMVNRIVKEFRPERIILFGSHARGEGTPDSDVDLLVIMPVEGSRREKQVEVRTALHDIPVPMDIIVTTPEDFDWRKKYPGTIERPAFLEGRVLYERAG
jgi:predicted nucleotidyltransferase